MLKGGFVAFLRLWSWVRVPAVPPFPHFPRHPLTSVKASKPAVNPYKTRLSVVRGRPEAVLDSHPKRGPNWVLLHYGH